MSLPIEARFVFFGQEQRLEMPLGNQEYLLCEGGVSRDVGVLFIISGGEVNGSNERVKVPFDAATDPRDIMRLLRTNLESDGMTGANERIRLYPFCRSLDSELKPSEVRKS